MRQLLLLSALSLPSLSNAATFKSIDVKGSANTCGVAITSNGLVAGNFNINVVVGNAGRSIAPVSGPFLYAAGLFTFPKIPLPSTDFVIVTGINKHRVTTVYDFNGSITSPMEGAYIDRHGMLATPRAAGHAASLLSAINDQGAVLGAIDLPPPAPLALGRTISFLQKPDGITTLIDDGSSLVTARGMDAHADRVVGYSFGNNLNGWLFANGIFTPVAVPTASFTIPAGVTQSGVIAGSYLVGDLGANPPPPSHGFFLANGVYTTYDVQLPGVTSTTIAAMNEARQITGCYTDAHGTHGFIRTP